MVDESEVTVRQLGSPLFCCSSCTYWRVITKEGLYLSGMCERRGMLREHGEMCRRWATANKEGMKPWVATALDRRNTTANIFAHKRAENSGAFRGSE